MMTPKELLYVEDALSHVKQMQTAFQSLSSQMTDPELKQFVQEMSSRQAEDFKNLYALLR